MRTFDKKQERPQEPVSTDLARSSAARAGARRRTFSVLNLQSTIGNQAVQRLLRSNAEEVRADSLGQPERSEGVLSPSARQSQASHVALPAQRHRPQSDTYEQEAEQAAQQVMGAAETPPARRPPGTSASVQRKAEVGSHGGAAQPGMRDALAAPARPLEPDTRAFMEARFGQDFSPVRITARREADPLMQGLNARALTHGERILFAPGEYAPHTAAGRRLLAHELAHVVQQRSSGQPRIALQTAVGNSLTDEAIDIQAELGNAPDAAARKPIVAKALQLASRASAALAVATGPNPPSGAPSADDAREALTRVARALAQSQEDQAAWQVATQSNDSEVMQAVITALGVGGSGVAGQQQFLIRLAPLVGEKLAPQGAKETSKQWLDKNTDTIGRIFKKLDAQGLRGLQGGAMGWELSSDLLREYLSLSDVDEKPDPTGQVARLNTEVQTQRIKADCDVYAAYGARLFRAQGWETVGYMVIVPQGRPAHAVALARRPNPQGGPGWEYLGISDWMISDFHLLSFDENAQVMLLGLALDIYKPNLPTDYTVYFEPAKPGGAYDLRLIDPVNNNLAPYKIVGNP